MAKDRRKLSPDNKPLPPNLLFDLGEGRGWGLVNYTTIVSSTIITRKLGISFLLHFPSAQ